MEEKQVSRESFTESKGSDAASSSKGEAQVPANKSVISAGEVIKVWKSFCTVELGQDD
jgi:hypothetical protein